MTAGDIDALLAELDDGRAKTLRLVEALEPRRRFESADGVRHFVRVIETAVG